MEFKKLHIREKVDLSEKIMTNQMKLLYKINDAVFIRFFLLVKLLKKQNAMN